MNTYNFENIMMTRFNSLEPLNIIGQSNLRNSYHRRYLWNKIFSCFDFDFGGLSWDLNTFRFCLFKFGTLALADTRQPGIDICFGAYSPKKYNIYYNPTEWELQLINKEIFLENRIYNEYNSTIIKCFDDYRGYADLVNDTAELLASCDRALNVALLNANVNLLGHARNKKEAAEIKAAYSLATQGEPLVMIDRDKLSEKLEDNRSLLEPFTQHDTIMSIDRILTARRTILNNFLTKTGIKNANFQKKERLITDEVNSNNEEVSSDVTIAYNNIKSGFDKFNKIANTNIKVDLHYNYNESEININDFEVNENV